MFFLILATRTYRTYEVEVDPRIIYNYYYINEKINNNKFLDIFSARGRLNVEDENAHLGSPYNARKFEENKILSMLLTIKIKNNYKLN